MSRAVWRGSVVAAKEIPTAGNSRILANELAVYRYIKLICNFNNHSIII